MLSCADFPADVILLHQWPFLRLNPPNLLAIESVPQKILLKQLFRK